jgi:hypothetical protein
MPPHVDTVSTPLKTGVAGISIIQAMEAFKRKVKKYLSP